MSVHWGGRGSGHISRWSASTTGVPSLVLDFLTTTSLDSRITFARASTATFVGSNGLLQTAAINAPRFECNPITLEAQGLLIEEQRTNIFLQSQTFDNASWSKQNSSVTTDVAISPDGTMNAEKLIENTTNNFHRVAQVPTLTAVSHTVSVYAKAAERNWLYLANASASRGAYFNLTTGVIGTLIGGATAKITPVGNGWYRCSVTAPANAGAQNYSVYLANADGSFIYTGDGVSGFFIYGAQLEIGTFGTSYIPTVASQVTRSPDIATMTGTNFSSWFNPSEGTLVASYEASPNLFATYVAASNGVVGQNSVHFDNDSGGTMRAVYYSGSVAQATLSLGAYGAAGTVNTVASAYAVNDFAASRNGGAVVTDTSGALPVSLTQLNIGADPSGVAANVTNTHIRSIRYYNKRLYDTQLQTLSQ